MKHIKLFESISDQLYEIGDYIILNRRIKYKTGKVLYFRDDKYTNSYLIEFITVDGVKLMELWFQENNIERKATTDEIEIFELQKKGMKYNL